MADVTAPSVQTSINPADAAATAPTAAPVHDQQIGPSQSPPDVSFPDETKNNITADMRAKAIKADQAARAAQADPMTKIHKKLDMILDLLHEVADNTSHDEPTEEDADFVADDDEDVEAEDDDEDEEEEAMETGDESEVAERGTKRDTTDEEETETPVVQRRKSRRA